MHDKIPPNIIAFARSRNIPLPGIDDPKPRATALKLDSYLSLSLPPELWRVSDLVPRVGLGGFLGSEKTGKSLLMMQAGLCIASGTPFLGHRVVAPCPVMIIEEEGSRLSFQNRLHKHVAALEISAPEIPLYVHVRSKVNLSDEGWISALSDEITSLGIGAVFVGPVSAVGHLADENSNSEWGALLRRMTQLSTDLDILITLAHHRRKTSRDERTGYQKAGEWFQSSRGGSALVGATDYCIGIDRDQEDLTGFFRVQQRDGGYSTNDLVFSDSSLTFSMFPRATAADKRNEAHDELLAWIAQYQPISASALTSFASMSQRAVQDHLNAMTTAGLCAKVPRQGRGGGSDYVLPDWSPQLTVEEP